ncbi:MAG: hypothetical protein Q8O42_14135 [Acidobacteriota bacterium]|nr:hypothetical protein [Acidobacteriota bacterium]
MEPTRQSDQEVLASALADAGDLLEEVAAALQRSPGLDPDTVRHTLALLRMDPLTRLNRSLLRGRAAAAHEGTAPGTHSREQEGCRPPKDRLVVPVLEEVVAIQAARSGQHG